MGAGANYQMHLIVYVYASINLCSNVNGGGGG